MFTGDITQMQSASSGIPHELTVKSGTQKIAYMTDIIRQKNSPVLEKAVIHASNREIKESFETLTTMNPEDFVKRQEASTNNHQHSIIAISCQNEKTKAMNYDPIYRAIANDYLTRIPEHQEKTMVIAHAHEDRKQINALIREGLQAQGTIAKNNVDCTRLPVKSMAKAQMLQASNFTPGDVLRFDASFSVAEKGAYFTVDAINKENNHLHCTSNDGNQFSINPASIAVKARMTVYTQEHCELAEGDRIRLRLTNKAKGHIANKEYTVGHIAEGCAHLFSNDNSKPLTLQLNDKQDAHWDYAYSRTAVGAQSATVTFVLALELAKRQQATTHRSHEIDITRSEYQATIYTEDKAKLVARLSELKGDKLSAFQLNAKANPANQSITDAKDIPIHTKQAVRVANQTPVKSINAEEMNNALVLKIKPLAEQLLGKPNGMSTANNLRYGSRGSLSINTHNGLWSNFETGEKGNALQLISIQMGFSDFKDTLDYANEFLNGHDSVRF